MIADACKPVMCIRVGGFSPRTPQENANAAWAELGKQMGFRPMTVEPILGQDDRHFTAEVIEAVVTATE